LLVRSVDQHTYEIVAGARRYRAAQLAGLEYVPVRIVELTDAQAVEVSIVENLQRRDVHPLDEAQGYVALMRLDYSIEQIGAKCGKTPAYVAARTRLAELSPAAVEAFLKDEIGVGHALLLAKLQPSLRASSIFRAAWPYETPSTLERTTHACFGSARRAVRSILSMVSITSRDGMPGLLVRPL
jgi:ParB family chromosome partitioning protein